MDRKVSVNINEVKSYIYKYNFISKRNVFINYLSKRLNIFNIVKENFLKYKKFNFKKLSRTERFFVRCWIKKHKYLLKSLNKKFNGTFRFSHLFSNNFLRFLFIEFSRYRKFQKDVFKSFRFMNNVKERLWKFHWKKKHIAYERKNESKWLHYYPNWWFKFKHFPLMFFRERFLRIIIFLKNMKFIRRVAIKRYKRAIRWYSRRLFKWKKIWKFWKSLRRIKPLDWILQKEDLLKRIYNFRITIDNIFKNYVANNVFKFFISKKTYYLRDIVKLFGWTWLSRKYKFITFKSMIRFLKFFLKKFAVYKPNIPIHYVKYINKLDLFNLFLVWQRRWQYLKKSSRIFLNKFKLFKTRKRMKRFKYRIRGLRFSAGKKLNIRRRRLSVWRKKKFSKVYYTWGRIHLFITFKQLIKMNIHVGHPYYDYSFLSAWMFKGWWNKLYIINVHRTEFSFRQALVIYRRVLFLRRPIWFVCVDKDFGSLLARYAFMCGEIFCSTNWIFGFYTNFKRIFSWSSLIKYYMNRNEHILRWRDKKRVISSFGVLYLKNRKSLPMSSFMIRVKGHLNIVQEFYKGNCASVAIIDSNIPSWNTNIPICGNDDSLSCVNFYLYIITKHILSLKIYKLKKWPKLRSNMAYPFNNFKKYIQLYFNNVIVDKKFELFDYNLTNPFIFINRKVHENILTSLNIFTSTLTVNLPFAFNLGHQIDNSLPKYINDLKWEFSVFNA